MKKTSTILYCAARYLEKNGVIRHRFSEFETPNEDGSYGKCCASGAIGVCATGSPYQSGLSKNEAIRAVFDKIKKPIIYWNDCEANDQTIISTLRQVAREQRKAGN